VRNQDGIFFNGLTDLRTDMTGPFQGPKHERSNFVKDVENM